jgi:AmmeMemoRadiSam system protein A
MAPSASIEISLAERQRLLRIARASITHGLDAGQPLALAPESFSGMLGAHLASFVTLRKHRDLRGCMGSLNPVRPLAEDVAVAAFNAALRDPRFAPLAPPELDETRIEIAVLTPMTPLTVESERELFEVLTPFEDGLLLEDDLHRATFLPKVWESLPEPSDFLSALKQKAGLPPEYPVAALRLRRYGALSFAEEPSLASETA